MGILWSFVSPLCMLAVYTFVFSVVFKAHWGEQSIGSKMSFAVILFIGLIVFSVFSEALARAPSLVMANINYVKKVIFPLEVLPVVLMGSVLFPMLMSITIFLAALLLLNGVVYWTAICFPLVLVPLIFFALGLTWVLASLGVFVRDVQQTIALVIMVMMFLTPIFYPLNALPVRYQG